MTLKEMIAHYVDEKPKLLARGERYLKNFGLYIRLEETGELITIDFDVDQDSKKTTLTVLEMLFELKERISNVAGDIIYITNFDREIRTHEPKESILALEEVLDMIHSCKLQLGIYATQEITKVIHVD